MFDVVIGNPPYQKEPTPSNYMAPLYHTFTKKSIETSKLVLFITPSRWFAAWGALRTFRKFMTSQPNRISLIRTFDEKNKVFGSHVDIKGGVSYFLYNHEHNGKCLYNGDMIDMSRYDVLITDNRFSSIIDKMNSHTSLASIMKSRSFWKIKTNDKNVTDKKNNSNFIVCYMSKLKGFKKYIENTYITNPYNYHKVFVAAAVHGGWSGLGNVFVGESKSVASASYMHFSVGDSSEAQSLTSFLHTDTANVLVSLRKPAQDLNNSTFKWVPLLPLDRTWDDASVYDYLGLSEEEVMLIKETAAKIKGAHNV